jgi:hypothetical protein
MNKLKNTYKTISSNKRINYETFDYESIYKHQLLYLGNSKWRWKVVDEYINGKTKRLILDHAKTSEEIFKFLQCDKDYYSFETYWQSDPYLFQNYKRAHAIKKIATEAGDKQLIQLFNESEAKYKLQKQKRDKVIFEKQQHQPLEETIIDWSYYISGSSPGSQLAGLAWKARKSVIYNFLYEYLIKHKSLPSGIFKIKNNSNSSGFSGIDKEINFDTLKNKSDLVNSLSLTISKYVDFITGPEANNDDWKRCRDQAYRFIKQYTYDNESLPNNKEYISYCTGSIDFSEIKIKKEDLDLS